ncbi:hypothetical protein JOS77_31550 [Chromobacterium haemolyticum]|nr:hypothetical protein JOS77_31550 [Chromobacterium haemolyticum]
MLIFDPDLVFLIVDNLFGSDGRYHVRVEGRDFTPTEQRIIRRLGWVFVLRVPESLGASAFRVLSIWFRNEHPVLPISPRPPRWWWR